MGLIRINTTPSRRDLTVFGLIWVVFFGVIGTTVLGRGGPRTAALVIWGLALGVPALGMLAPGFLRLVYIGMAYLAFPIGFVLSHVILALVYYGVMTPTGLLMRPFGYDPMHRRFDPGAETYWAKRDEEANVERYFRQF